MTAAKAGKAAKPPTTEDLLELLRVDVDRLGSKRALAKQLGLTEGRLGRVLRGEFSLSVLSCLRFSKISGVAPSQILRAALKGEVADLIESLYAVRDTVISPAELELLRRYRLVGAKTQHLVRDLVQSLETGPTPASATRKRG